MPELPDITIYLEAIQARALGRELVAFKVRSPFLLRTFKPGPEVFTEQEREYTPSRETVGSRIRW